jgi:hypothetical protein
VTSKANSAALSNPDIKAQLMTTKQKDLAISIALLSTLKGDLGHYYYEHRSRVSLSSLSTSITFRR